MNKKTLGRPSYEKTFNPLKGIEVPCEVEAALMAAHVPYPDEDFYNLFHVLGLPNHPTDEQIKAAYSDMHNKEHEQELRTLEHFNDILPTLSRLADVTDKIAPWLDDEMSADLKEKLAEHFTLPDFEDLHMLKPKIIEEEVVKLEQRVKDYAEIKERYYKVLHKRDVLIDNDRYRSVKRRQATHDRFGLGEVSWRENARNDEPPFAHKRWEIKFNELHYDQSGDRRLMDKFVELYFADASHHAINAEIAKLERRVEKIQAVHDKAGARGKEPHPVKLWGSYVLSRFDKSNGELDKG